MCGVSGIDAHQLDSAPCFLVMGPFRKHSTSTGQTLVSSLYSGHEGEHGEALMDCTEDEMRFCIENIQHRA